METSKLELPDSIRSRMTSMRNAITKACPVLEKSEALAVWFSREKVWSLIFISDDPIGMAILSSPDVMDSYSRYVYGPDGDIFTQVSGESSRQFLIEDGAVPLGESRQVATGATTETSKSGLPDPIRTRMMSMLSALTEAFPKFKYRDVLGQWVAAQGVWALTFVSDDPDGMEVALSSKAAVAIRKFVHGADGDVLPQVLPESLLPHLIEAGAIRLI
jgi:hypothetical protein